LEEKLKDEMTGVCMQQTRNTNNISVLGINEKIIVTKKVERQ
jgi:hypothetical protein